VEARAAAWVKVAEAAGLKGRDPFEAEEENPLFAEAARLAEKAALDTTQVAERQVQAALVCDIFANPFRSGPAIERATLAWSDCTVVRLATAIYDERAFGRMPILADALQEAGCDHEV
jgi:hypothetical protein